MTPIELHIRIDNAYIPVLSIPVDDCNRFALKPLRWLRFLGYTIYGNQGHISATADGPPVDYESAIEGGARFYFTSAAAPHLLDVCCIDDRTSATDAETTESREEFFISLQDRDGTCIFTDAPPFHCEGAHIYPHSKGGQYISRLMENRGDGQLKINDINDIRNGLFLVQSLHKAFGFREVAFLQTPNFAMNDNDVPPSSGPIFGLPSASPGRFILQHFTPQPDFMVRIAPHNQDARLPADMSQFPPPIIVDMCYGCAAVLRWGIPQATAAIQSSVGSLYYDKTGSGELNSLVEARDGEDDIERARPPTPPRSRRVRVRESRHGDQTEGRINTIDEAMDLLMLLWSRTGPKPQEKPPTTQEEDTRRDRVQAWLQTQ